MATTQSLVPAAVEDRETVEAVPEAKPADVAETDTTDVPYDEAIIAEYAEYVALGPITYMGAVAFAKGQRVGRSHPCVPMWLEGGYIAPVVGA